MKRSYRFVEPSGFVVCSMGGEHLDVPVFAGILKHPTAEQLETLLTDPLVVRRYTAEALRKAPWCVLRQFPISLLVELIPHARLPDLRRKALELLLGAPGAVDPPVA